MDEEDQSEIFTLQMEVEMIDCEVESIGNQINGLLAKQEKFNRQKKNILKKIQELEKDGTRPAEKVADWNSESFPWSVKLKEMMKKHFGLSKFRPLQKETMNVTLSNKDCILIMPTGGGKSLSFQLPALVSPGFTLVISPLLALMEDQLIGLRKLNINAMMISSVTNPTHNTEVLSKMIAKSTDMKILYVTPERLAKSKRFMAKLDKAYSVGNISRIVIDEVHCASNWGHDFRPDYKTLCILKRQYPKVPLLGLTATASEKVLVDVKDILSLEKCIVFRSSFNRPNLFYEVYKTALDQKSLIVDIAKRIKLEFKNMSGIVYCFSRRDSEEVASGLVDHGIIAECYHADVSAALKTNVHEGWLNGDIQVVVATVAFGMGIDKPNVRFVIHFSISKSMENYYQESGRAGRDDNKSWCILYLRFQDIWRQASMVFTEKTGLQNLHDMLHYVVDRQKCRRTLIGKHFAEKWPASGCKKMCDNCQRDPEAMQQRSLDEEAGALIQILQDASYREERLTPIKLIDNWLGKCKVRDRPKELCYLPRDECENIVTKLLVDQILQEDFHFTPYNTITYIIPGIRWPLLKHGKISVKIDTLRKSKLSKLDKGQDDQVINDLTQEVESEVNKKRKTKSNSNANEPVNIISDTDSDSESNNIKTSSLTVSRSGISSSAASVISSDCNKGPSGDTRTTKNGSKSSACKDNDAKLSKTEEESSQFGKDVGIESLRTNENSSKKERKMDSANSSSNMVENNAESSKKDKVKTDKNDGIDQSIKKTDKNNESSKNQKNVGNSETKTAKDHRSSKKRKNSEKSERKTAKQDRTSKKPRTITNNDNDSVSSVSSDSSSSESDDPNTPSKFKHSKAFKKAMNMKN